eukprot:CAMPEP_0185621710 /NCGR_PEP_ID=MMETSP0436-20130131/58282_1 /TAXON_ID=626734 ORGANISM="Favella taraikaensis, Strain Fe Narragansett Bay" /NCGR_SAMPLE_ID=MMETSP0436 /ASSEMBLY_ACC=CAM_ASM_000390 /LENGTH=105 /DNA_ID=CAMNT_0028263199 /DNA_START=308 /DNA_END=625 /DNA_ORIENTATION=+
MEAHELTDLVTELEATTAQDKQSLRQSGGEVVATPSEFADSDAIDPLEGTKLAEREISPGFLAPDDVAATEAPVNDARVEEMNEIIAQAIVNREPLTVNRFATAK